MKKSLLFVLLFLCLVANAQLHVDTQVASQTNTVFSLLEKNRIPHQILLDYGYDFLDATQYDGVLRSNNYLSPAIYRELYNTMLSSRINTTVPELVAPEDLEDAWASKRKSETNKFGKGSPTTALVLNGLYYKYSRIRSNALSQNDIAVANGKYDDVYISGTWQNPYETKSTFGMTMPVQEIANSKISLLLDADTWYTNQATSVSSFAVDFGDGSGYKSFSLGTALLHTYTNDGEYTVTFRLGLSNGQYLYCRNRLKVTGMARQSTLSSRNPGCNNSDGSFPTQPITASRSFQSVAGSATLQIAYANTCGQITKPLIVAEGLDTGLIQEGGRIGDSDIVKFLDFVFDSNSIDLRNLITNNTANDYDIIYVNWDNGTDDLRRNAYVLQEAINWVNANKTGNAPNVVLGQSMGGVIARYALKDMENRNEDHDTNLYISHDAPHQGAHIPLGYFYMARQLLNEVITTPVASVGIFLAGGSADVRDVRSLLDSQAAKQLLTNYVRSDYALDNDVFNAWQSELRSMGYPQQTRNVALSNASHCAEPQGLGPNQQLFRLNGSGNTRAFTDVVLFFSGLGFLPGAALGDVSTTLLGFLPGKATLETDFQVKAFPSSGTANIYSGRITYKKTFLWLVPITRTITDRSFSSPSGSLFQDNFSGGVPPFYGQVESSSDFKSNFFARYNYNLDVVENVNFISAVSALDVGSGATTLTTSDYTRTYTQSNRPTGSKAIPFANFTTSFNSNSENEIHLSFNPRNGDWLADELNNTVSLFDCTFICGTPQIFGSATLCTQDTYSVDVFGDAQVQWSSSDNNAASPTNPNSPTTSFTTPTNTYRKSVTITATITSNNCGAPPVVLNKTLWVGRPATPTSLSGPTTVNTGALVTYNGSAASGATSYEWRLPYPFDRVNQFDYFAGNWQIHNSTTYYDGAQVFTGYDKNAGYVQLIGKNQCGTGGAKLLYVQHASRGGGGTGGGGAIPRIGDPNDDHEITVYPNPARNKTTVSITIFDEYEGDPPTLIYGIEVLNQSGNVIKFYDLTVPTPTEEINVAFLSAGLNYLRVYTDFGTFSKKLLIE